MNGGVIITSNRLNGVATYECEVGHRIDGEETRTCVGEGVWSGSAPLCRSKSLILNYRHYLINITIFPVNLGQYDGIKSQL